MSSYFDTERPLWYRSYPVAVSTPGDTQAGFLRYTPPPRLTWTDLVRKFAEQGQIETRDAAGPSNPILHYTTVCGTTSPRKQQIVAIGGHKLVQPVEAARIGTSAGVPYLHAEHLLYALYKAQGGTLPRTRISASRMASAYDLIV